MSKKKPKQKTYSELFQSQRRDWGDINPVTKVIPNKKKNRKEKHKHKEMDV